MTPQELKALNFGTLMKLLNVQLAYARATVLRHLTLYVMSY